MGYYWLVKFRFIWEKNTYEIGIVFKYYFKCLFDNPWI